jgi:uncharacterized protein DUF6675
LRLGSAPAGAIRSGVRANSLALLVLVLLYTSAAAQGPSPPCGGAPQPSYPAAGEPERSGIWTTSELGASWVPPQCTGWTGTDFRLLVAVAGRIRDPRSMEQLLSRFGSISGLVGLRYWSATERSWKELVTSASAVQGPAGKRPRADFSLAELGAGNSVYFSQTDNRSSGSVVYRMTVLEARPDRVVIGIENVTSIRLLLITLFPPGSAQTTDFLERQPDGSWGYYSLVRTRASSSMLTGTFLSSYVNRAVAFFRHIAGIPEEAQPAMAR